MAKKKEVEIVENNVEWGLEDIMSDRFARYSKYIIQERALPDARDGLKPVQRRILFAMDHDGNTNDKPHRKSAKTVGLVIGTYHPHGDTSVYDAMVRMSQDWKINVPLIDMHGNNGSIDDDPPAAMRYTEARLSKYSSLLLNDIDKGTVAMTNNYDDTELEPTVLPATFPLLLVNGATGIASGYATNIAPHNLNEVIEATIYRYENPECSLDELMNFVKGPDFPTGGIVQGKEEIKKVFSEGKGKVVLRARSEIVENRTNNQIVISEVPYEVIKCELVKDIDSIRLNRDLDGIMDVRDESDRNGIKIVIDLKKDLDPQLVLNYLYKNTDLQVNYSYNMIAIENHRPVILSLARAIDAFIDFRKEVVLNRSHYLLNQKQARMHVLEGLMKAISILDEVIEIIRSSKDKADSKRRLKEAFLFSEEQAEAIVTLRLYRLSSTDITLLKEEYTKLASESNELKGIISSADILRSTIIKELRQVASDNPSPRKTVIEDEVEEIVINKEAMIANEGVYISITRDGYIRRYSERIYASNPDSLPSFKEGDYLLGISHCETLDNLLIFLDSGEYAHLPIYRLEDSKWKEIGTHLSHYVKLNGGEKIVSAVLVKNFETGAYIITVSSSGMIKRSLVSGFQLNRYNRPSVAMKLKQGDKLIGAKLSYDKQEILLVSKDGYYNRYSSEVLTPISTHAQGVKGINVKNDEVATFTVIDDKPDTFIVESNANAKRIHLSDIPTTNRATKGLRLFKQRKSSPFKVKYVFTTNSSDSFIAYDKSEMNWGVKDVPLMDREASFSKGLALNSDFFLLHSDLSDIEMCQTVPLKQEVEIKSNPLEEISLFDEVFKDDDEA